MNNVGVMLCYARSGGTILNRCLGGLPGVVIMSEVNPLGGGWGVERENSYTTVQEQAAEWYGIELENRMFSDAVEELSYQCDYLILRDWSFVNFFPHEYNSFTPSNTFMILDVLKDKVKTKPFGFVRNYRDTFISKGGKLKEFVESYYNYAHALSDLNVPIFKYESFCVNPRMVLINICNYLDLDIAYDDVCLDYHQFTTVNGDVQHDSRGERQGKIAPLPRQDVPIEISEALDRQESLKEADKMLGY